MEPADGFKSCVRKLEKKTTKNKQAKQNQKPNKRKTLF